MSFGLEMAWWRPAKEQASRQAISRTERAAKKWPGLQYHTNGEIALLANLARCAVSWE
jgi:hypothetical protein